MGQNGKNMLKCDLKHILAVSATLCFQFSKVLRYQADYQIRNHSFIPLGRRSSSHCQIMLSRPAEAHCCLYDLPGISMAYAQKVRPRTHISSHIQIITQITAGHTPLGRCNVNSIAPYYGTMKPLEIESIMWHSLPKYALSHIKVTPELRGGCAAVHRWQRTLLGRGSIFILIPAPHTTSAARATVSPSSHSAP